MNLDHDFVQVSKLSEDQKKSSLHQKWNTEHFFFPNLGEDQKKRSSSKMEQFFPRIQVDTYPQRHMYQSQIIVRDADVDHTQAIGRDISPQVSAPLCQSQRCMIKMPYLSQMYEKKAIEG